MRTAALSHGMYPAKMVAYDAVNRTAKVTIAGLTDGVPDGIPAMLAYPIGDDDLDTERELIPGADVWVFFEQGDTTKPIIAFYRRHGQGRAVTETRRIRQENIELLARTFAWLKASELIVIEGDVVHIKATTLKIDANIEHNGDTSQQGAHHSSGIIKSDSDVLADGISGKNHRHIKGSGPKTQPPS